jgi:hypothetical protein
MKEFIGKEVALFPHDTYKKNAIVLNVDEYGVTFKITSCDSRSDYKVGEVIFINHASKISISSVLRNI